MGHSRHSRQPGVSGSPQERTLGQRPPQLGAKRLELVHELLPKATAIGVLVNPNNPIADTQLRDLYETARAIGLQISVLNASAEHDLDMAFATIVQQRAGALLIGGDPFFGDRRDRLLAWRPAWRERRHHLPVPSPVRFRSGFH